MLLVATAFLALAGFVEDIVSQSSVAFAVPVVIGGAVEERAIAAENADAHDGDDARRVPVAIGESREIFDGREDDFPEHLLAAGHLLGLPSGISIPHQLGG